MAKAAIFGLLVAVTASAQDTPEELKQRIQDLEARVDELEQRAARWSSTSARPSPRCG